MDQPTEAGGQLFLIVIDETYGIDEETWEAESERYRQGLEREFGSNFREVNVGPGADIPAFLTDLMTANVPAWTVLLGGFFAGKAIKENREAWGGMIRAIRRFSARPVVLGRHGAAVLAVEAVMDEIGGLPKIIRLKSYRAGHFGEYGSLAEADPGEGIAQNPPTLNLGQVIHLFEIEADGMRFRVSVKGRETEVLRANDEAKPIS